MLEFWKDGKSVRVSAIGRGGRVWQVVILDRVNFGESPNFEKYPLAKYSQPSAFVIIEKVNGEPGVYYALDNDGQRIKLSDNDNHYLYDAGEWLAWRTMHEKEKLGRKERRIEHLEGQVALMKEILSNQGVKIVSEKVAKELGIA